MIGVDNAGIVSMRKERTDTRNRKGTNLIYYGNNRTIREYGLRPVTLQDFVVTIIINSFRLYFCSLLRYLVLD